MIEDAYSNYRNQLNHERKETTIDRSMFEL